MSRSLPPQAHLEHLKKQAKDLLKAARNGEPGAVDRLRAHLTRLSSKPQTAGHAVTLQEAQFVVAREYGYGDWADLVREVAPRTRQRTMHRVQQVHEALLSPVTSIFSSCLERAVDAAIVEVRSLTTEDYVRSLGSPCWNYSFRLDGRPLGGHLSFSLPLCVALVQPKASGKDVRRRSEEIKLVPVDPELPSHNEAWASDTDFSTLAQPVKAMAEEIERAWGIGPEVGVSDIELETVPSLIDRSSEPAVVVRFEVVSEGYEDLSLSLCYALRMIASLEKTPVA